MPKSGTGYKALYMRQRKNLMQKARYYDVKLPHIATARELDRKIQKSDIKTLSNLEKSYINPIRVSRAATRNEIRVESQKLQNLTNEQIAKKYSSRFTKVLPKHDGTSVLIDKFTNEELGYSGYISREELGEYLRSKYGKTAYTVPGARQGNPVEDVMILEAFKTEIQSRINAAAHDMATGQHGSAAGIEKIQKLLDNFGKQDWENAYFKYENYVDEIRNYLDEALYYSEDEQSHLRAINILEDLLGADKMDIDFDAADYSEGLDDFSDYQFGRPYKFTKKPKPEPYTYTNPDVETNSVVQLTEQEPEPEPENRYKTYKAYVKDSSGERTTITSEYSNKNSFINDLKANGYTVIYSALEQNYDLDKFLSDKEADLNNQPRQGETYMDMLNRKSKNYKKRHKL